jgi:hypothetical protein
MGPILSYLRRHHWQRRISTLLLAVIVAMAVATLAYPPIRDRQIIESLAAPSPAARQDAIARAYARASQREVFVRRLESALDTRDDRQFDAIATVLMHLNRFHTPSQPGRNIDRLRRIAFQQNPPLVPAATMPDAPDESAAVRQRLVQETVLAGRVNVETAALLALALRDPATAVRAEAALLAVTLRQDNAIAALLSDGTPSVRARTMQSLAMAGLTSFADRVAARLAVADDDAEQVAAAYALATLAPQQAGPLVARRLADSTPGAVRDQLLCIAMALPRDAVVPAVLAAMRQQAGPMELLAAGALGLAEAEPLVRQSLLDISPENALARRDEFAAAAWAAPRVGLNDPALLAERMRTLFHPGLHRPMLELSLAVSYMMTHTPAATTAPSDDARPAVVDTLTAAAARADAPLAAAAAAWSLWTLDPRAGAAAVATAAGAESPIAGDWLAWQMATRDPQSARHAGKALLDAPYGDEARAAGAMMLALSCRGTGDASWAETAILQRFGPAEAPIPRDPALVESYRCALALLGHDEFLPHLRSLLAGSQFPLRRLLTTLLLADPEHSGLHYLLGSELRSDAELDYLLGTLQLADVLRAARPDLPRFDPLAGRAVRLWQLSLLRDAYLLSPSAP